MAKLNLTQAAKRVGVSRQTFYRHIDKKGISVSKDEEGRKAIDESELFRVYGDALQVDVKSDVTPLHDVTPKKAKSDSGLQVKVAVLEERLSGRDEMIEHLKAEIRELKGKDEDNQRLLMDLRVEAAKTPPEAPPRKLTMWERLTGKTALSGS